MNFGAAHGALAAVGERELAANRQDFFMRQKRRDSHALLALDNRIIARGGGGRGVRGAFGAEDCMWILGFGLRVQCC